MEKRSRPNEKKADFYLPPETGLPVMDRLFLSDVIRRNCCFSLRLSDISGVSPSKIRELNGFTTDHAIKPGDTVLIPQEVTTAMSSPTNRVGGASSSTKRDCLRAAGKYSGGF